MEFELAQKRLKERQRNRSMMLFWFALFCITIIMNVIFGGIVEWWVPLELFTAIMTARKGLQLIYNSPRRPIRRNLIEQEMNWLFGEDWRDYSGAQEITFAQDRIRRRRMERWGFLLHLLFFVPVSAFSIYGISFLEKYGQPGGAFCLALPLTWLVLLLLPHAWRVFPLKDMLANRERKVGIELRLELQQMQPDKRKNDDKPKRETRYAVGDDGELVELSEADEEKGKRKLE